MYVISLEIYKTPNSLKSLPLTSLESVSFLFTPSRPTTPSHSNRVPWPQISQISVLKYAWTYWPSTVDFDRHYFHLKYVNVEIVYTYKCLLGRSNEREKVLQKVDISLSI